MDLIAKMWNFAEMCSHDDQDSGDNDGDKKDYIKDNLQKEFPGSIITTCENSLDYMYIIESENEVVFVWRGTVGLDGWIDDFNIFPLYDDMIHNGFYDAIQPFIKPIYDYLNQCKDKKVYYTGHSRGGALSQLAAYILAKKYNIKGTVVAFGSPVVGNKNFKTEYEQLVSDSTRVVNGYDLITRIGDQTIAKHAGKLLHLKQPWWHWFSNIRKLYDHAYSQYTDALIKYYENKKDKEAVNLLKNIRKRCNI